MWFWLPQRSDSIRILLASLTAFTIMAGSLDTSARGETSGRVVNIALEDQFRTRRETGALLGDVVVLVFAERKGAEAAHDLGRKLHIRFHPTAASASDAEWTKQPVTGLPGWPAEVRVPDVHAIPVACLAEVPKPMHPVVRARIRKESPQLPVWLDFGDTMDQQFGLVKGVPSVAILDTRGRVYGVQVGPFDDRIVEELAATIDQVRLAARPQIITAAATAPVVR
jgi:hypothetical protein